MRNHKYDNIHAESADLQEQFQKEKDPKKKEVLLAKIFKFVNHSLWNGVNYGGASNSTIKKDIEQEAAMDLIRGIRNETGHGSLHAYAFKIGMRAAINHGKRHFYKRRFDVPMEDYHLDTQSIDFEDIVEVEENDTENKFKYDRACELIETLPDIQKDIMKMIYLKNMTLKECSNILGIKWTVVYYQKVLALKTLKKYFEGNDEND